MTQRDIAELFRIGTTTVQRVLRDHDDQAASSRTADSVAPLADHPRPAHAR